MLVSNLVVSIYIFKFILNSINIIVSVHNGASDDFENISYDTNNIFIRGVYQSIFSVFSKRILVPFSPI